MPDDLPRPSPSRRPPAPEFTEEPTGVHPASRDFVREVNKSGLWAVSLGVGGFAVVCFLAGISVTKAMAQSAEDAGVKAATDVKRQADATQRELERFELEVRDSLKSTRESQSRTEQKFDKLLERMQIPNPAPAPKDGGH